MSECDAEHGHSTLAALATNFALDPKLCILPQQTRDDLANYYLSIAEDAPTDECFER